MTRPAACGSGIDLDHLLSLADAAAAAAYPSSLASGQQPHPYPSSLLGAIDRFGRCQQQQQQEPGPAEGSSLAYALGAAPSCAASLPRLIHQQHKGRHYHQQPLKQAKPAVLKRSDWSLSLDTLSSDDDAGSSSGSGSSCGSGTENNRPSPPTSSASSVLFRLDCALESQPIISARGGAADSTLSQSSAGPCPHFLGHAAAGTAAAAAMAPLQLQYMAAAAAEPCGPHISICGMMPKLQRQQQLLAWATDHYPMYVPAPLYVDHSSPAALLHTNELLASACLPGQRHSRCVGDGVARVAHGAGG